MRVIERESGAPVPGFAAMLIPDGAATFDLSIIEELSDERGKILWDDLSWRSARIDPPYDGELFALPPGAGHGLP